MAKKDANGNLEEIKEALSSEQTPEAAGETVEFTAAGLQALGARLKKAEDEAAAEKDRFLRLAAEYDNYRKRTQREMQSIFNDVTSETVEKLLPVYDNLARALDAETEDKAFYRGVEMTMAQMREIFEKMGVQEIPALGEKFDPSLHDAVIHVKDESRGESEIVAELQKGFTLDGKVIRCSMVQVAN